MLRTTQQQRQSGGATILGALGLLFATTGAFVELQGALNDMWKGRGVQDEGVDVKLLVSQRVRAFGVVVALGFLLTVTLAINAVIAITAEWLGTRAPGWPQVLAVLQALMSFGITTGLFLLLYTVLPDRHVPWRHALMGALVAAVLFVLGQQAIAWYLGQRTLTPFGAAGAVVGVLVWVYYSAQIVLFGAEVARLVGGGRVDERANATTGGGAMTARPSPPPGPR
jgi:membrane protein